VVGVDALTVMPRGSAAGWFLRLPALIGRFPFGGPRRAAKRPARIAEGTIEAKPVDAPFIPMMRPKAIPSCWSSWACPQARADLPWPRGDLAQEFLVSGKVAPADVHRARADRSICPPLQLRVRAKSASWLF
jgi:hypothetical protein